MIFTNLAFLIAVVSIYAIGYEYDREHRLYPESIQISYDMSIGGVYGQRWERTAKFLLIVGGLSNAVILLSWYRNLQSEREAGFGLRQEL